MIGLIGLIGLIACSSTKYSLLASQKVHRRWFNLHQMGFSGLDEKTIMWHDTRRGTTESADGHHGHHGTMGDGYHGSEEMDFHPRTCPKSWRGGNCKQIHKISQISEEIGWDWLFFHELNREISWNLMKFHISSMLQIWPHAPHAVRVEIWILSISRWLKLWLQSHPWLGVRRHVRWRQVASVRLGAWTLVIFVFSFSREFERSWTILNNSGHL